MGVGEPAVLEIHGVNPLELPKLYVTVSVTDALGRSIPDLAASEFAIAGQIAELGRLVDVEHITNDNLDFAVVLALDTSSSMFGFPLNALKEAANSFIDLIGDNAMVALIDFDSDSQHILDFTTDQRTLRAAIADLLAGGTTALYQASLEAVELAANAPTPRRAVIILSDGHEYGGVSSAEREDARTAAAHRGVPVYTIGLGYDQFDRDYLQNLSAAGYGTFSESPTPEQLKALYQGFASLFRGQYVLTIEADLPLDGNRYSLAVELETAAGRIASALGDVRAPIPVPYITPLVELPLTPIREPTRFSFAVAADDALAEVILELDGVPVETIMEAGAYGTTVVPVQMAPGPYELTITARDVDGDAAQVSQPFAVAALPPEITVTSSLLEEPVLTEPTEVSVTVGGQTRFATAKIMIDGVAEASLEEEIRLTLDPYDFDAGLHDVEFIVTNEADQAASQQLTFEVPPLPPVFEFEGLESGDLLEEATQLDLALIEAQPGSALLSRYRLNDGPDIPIEGEIELDPRDLPPGEHTITVAVEDQTTGETSEETVDFSVPPLKPESVIEGLEAGDELREDRRIEVEVESQTEVLRVVARLNGEEIERILEAPYEVDLDVLDLPPGDHTLEIQVVNEGLREEVTTIEFSVAEEPAQTATAVVVTATQRAVVTATARGAMTATQRAQVTATQEARATATEIVRAAATQGARATATIQSLRERARENVRLTATQRTHATATEIVRAAATQRAQVTATQEARATATQHAQVTATEIVRATATQEAQATATQRAQATATQDARATATQEAQATATEIVRATATQEARATATEIVRATATQEARATATEIVRVTATQRAQATATEIMRATATQEAQATATEIVRVTATQRAQAAATEIVRATATQEARATATIQSLRERARENVRVTATQRAHATATARSQMTATQLAAAATERALADAQATATEIMRATATQEAQATATEIVRATATQEARATATEIVRATATQEARATATQEARATATEIVRATATQEARATATEIVRAVATQRAQATATEIVRATATQEARATATIQSLREQARENVRLTATQRAHVIAMARSQMTATQLAAAATERALADAQATATEISRATATQEAWATAAQAAALATEATATLTGPLAAQQDEAVGTATAEATLVAASVADVEAEQTAPPQVAAVVTATALPPSPTAPLETTDLPEQPLPTEEPLVVERSAASEKTPVSETAVPPTPLPTESPTVTPTEPPTEAPTETPTISPTVPSTVTAVPTEARPEPTATLIPVEVAPPAEPTDNTALLVVSVVVLLLLSTAFFLLRGRRG